MKNALALFIACLCFVITSCHRPVAYFQRTPYASARVPAATPKPVIENGLAQDSSETLISVDYTLPLPDRQAVASVKAAPVTAQATDARVERRMRRIASLLAPQHATAQAKAQERVNPNGPGPKPRKQMRLGNRIREKLGMPLRKDLNWWQRISWKLKASVIVILVAVLFAILHVTILAIIFGILGAFLLITGLKRSFKVRRPWF